MNKQQLHTVANIFSKESGIYGNLNKFRGTLEVPESEVLFSVFTNGTTYDKVYAILDAWISRKAASATVSKLTEIVSVEEIFTNAVEKIQRIEDDGNPATSQQLDTSCKPPLIYGFKDTIGIECVGRKTELEKLSTLLQTDENSKKPAVITGISGIGKSVLLNEYFRQLAENQSIIASCFESSSAEALRESISEFRKELCLNSDKDASLSIDNQLDKLCQYISKNSDASLWYIIADSCNNELSNLFGKVGNMEKVRLIFVSNRRDFRVVGAVKPSRIFEIQGFDDKTAAEFLTSELEFHGNADLLSKIEKICKKLQNHPLSLKQAACFIKMQDRNYTVADYLDALRETGHAGLENPLELIAYSNTTLNIWADIFRNCVSCKLRTVVLNYLEIFSTICCKIRNQFLEHSHPCFSEKEYRQVVKVLNENFLLEICSDTQGKFVVVHKFAQFYFRHLMKGTYELVCTTISDTGGCNISGCFSNILPEFFKGKGTIKMYDNCLSILWKNLDLQKSYLYQDENMMHVMKLWLHSVHVEKWVKSSSFRVIVSQLESKARNPQYCDGIMKALEKGKYKAGLSRKTNIYLWLNVIGNP